MILGRLRRALTPRRFERRLQTQHEIAESREERVQARQARDELSRNIEEVNRAFRELFSQARQDNRHD